VRYVRTNHLHHRGVRNTTVRAIAASIFPQPHGDPLATNHMCHGVALRFPRSVLRRVVVDALAIPP
jgi:hypothetical protein